MSAKGSPVLPSTTREAVIMQSSQHSAGPIGTRALEATEAAAPAGMVIGPERRRAGGDEGGLAADIKVLPWTRFGLRSVDPVRKGRNGVQRASPPKNDGKGFANRPAGLDARVEWSNRKGVRR
jgi:hypothetical protein